MNKYLLSAFAFTALVYGWGCHHYSCNPSLEYAMGKQRIVLLTKLDDFKGAIRGMNSGVQKMTKLYILESLELIRLRERKKIESIKYGERNHIDKNIKGKISEITR